jgi:hypothetical protein
MMSLPGVAPRCRGCFHADGDESSGDNSSNRANGAKSIGCAGVLLAAGRTAAADAPLEGLDERQ